MNRVTVLIPCCYSYLEDVIDALREYVVVKNHYVYEDRSTFEFEGYNEADVDDPHDFTNLVTTAVWEVIGEHDVVVSVEHLDYEQFRYSEEYYRRYMRDVEMEQSSDQDNECDAALV